MGKRARHKHKHKRRKQINTAGVIVSATPNLDQARQWRDEIHAARAHDQELEQPTAGAIRVPDGQPGWRPPPPPWKATP